MAKTSFEPVPGLLRQATDVGEGVPAYVTARDDGVRFTLIDNSLGRPDRTDVDVPLSDVDIRKVDKRTAIIVVDGEPWIFTAHDPIRAPLSPAESSSPSLILSQLTDPIRSALAELRGLFDGQWITTLARVLRRSVLSALFAVIIFAFGWMSGRYGGAGAALLTTILVLVSIVAGSLWGWRTQTPAQRVHSSIKAEQKPPQPRPAQPTRDPVQEALAQRLADALTKVGNTLDSGDEHDQPSAGQEAAMPSGHGRSEEPLPPPVPLAAHRAELVADDADAVESADDGSDHTLDTEQAPPDEMGPVPDSAITEADVEAPAETPIVFVSGTADEPDITVETDEERSLPGATDLPTGGETPTDAEAPSLSSFDATRILASLDGIPLTDEQTLGDNLELIHGVGPSYAALLKELGFSTFEAIANIDDADLEEIERRAGPLRWRIERDGWIEGARRLLESGEGADQSRNQAPDRSDAGSEAHQAI